MPAHILTLLAGLALVVFGLCQNATPQQEAQTPAATASHAILLTIFLRHDQSRTLDQLEEQLKKTGFYRDFPPPGTEVVSWYVVMGIGQVVTLSVPPERLRETNRYFEQRAWGAFRTEFYPTYDFRAAWQQIKSQQQTR
jgi:hypothetical protein